MKLWIDDIRTPPEGWDWTWAMSANEAMRYLSMYWHTITDISFDHDLGEHSKTGYDILNWIEGRIHDGHTFDAKMTVHSANPVGRKNMQQAIQSINQFITSV